MKTIKLKFCDFWGDYNYKDDYFYNILKEKYDVQISDDPDYIIYSTFGGEHLKYDCIRIFYTGENVRPDFNLCDYAIGFDFINYEDRYIRFPLYMQYETKYKMALNKHKINSKTYKIHERFCDFVYSNNNADPVRKKFYDMLNEYKHIDSGGRYMNNVGGPVEDKVEFQSHHKFSIAFENSTTNGYTTEKIIEPFAAGTIPIYWGNPKIAEEFNSKAFINCFEYENLNEVVELVEKVDNDDELYLSYIRQPILKNENLAFVPKDNLKKFLFAIFDNDLEKARRRTNNNIHVINYEKRIKSSWNDCDNLSGFISKVKSMIKR